MGEFNRVQRELGKKEISKGSSHNWLKTFRPEFVLIKRTTVMAVQKVKLKFMLQSAQASPQDVKKLEDELKCIKQQKGLRWTSRLYNVPLETLRRQVTGAVEQGCTTWTPNSS